MTWIPGLVGGGPGGGAAPAQLHDTTHSPVGLWQFDGDLLDTSGTGETLTVEAGTQKFSLSAIPDGTRSLQVNAGLRLVGANPAAAALRIAGDITIELLCKPVDIQAASTFAILIDCAGDQTSETETNNVLWGCNLQVAANEPFIVWERGAGINESLTDVDFGVEPGRWNHLAFVRDASGGAGSVVASIFVNGVLFATDATKTTASGGSLARIRVGASTIAGRAYNGLLSSVKVIASVLTAPQILAEAQRTLPPDLRP